MAMLTPISENEREEMLPEIQ